MTNLLECSPVNMLPCTAVLDHYLLKHTLPHMHLCLLKTSCDHRCILSNKCHMIIRLHNLPGPVEDVKV